MKPTDADLQRLLRSAAKGAPRDADIEMPFGFDTRVVALARQNEGRSNGAADLTRFVRRIGAVALAIFAIASAGAYQQFTSEEDAEETPIAEAYAMADSAIQSELSP
jgi:hypothetical protein